MSLARLNAMSAYLERLGDEIVQFNLDEPSRGLDLGYGLGTGARRGSLRSGGVPRPGRTDTNLQPQREYPEV